MSEPLRPVMVRLPEPLAKALEESAERNDRTLAQEARRAIRLYLAQQIHQPESGK